MPGEHEPLTPKFVAKVAAAALVTVAFVFLLIFTSAGTWSYREGWIYFGLFALYFFVGTPMSLWFMPDLVRRRMIVGPRAEQEKSQKRIMAFAWPAFCLVYVIPGLDRRYEWSAVPAAAVFAALALVLAGMILGLVVSLHNHYMASTITVEKGQPVISTGPYAWVRHPLYAATGLWFGATPVALGSWWGLLAGALLMGVLVIRLLDEERFLQAHLPGYDDYCRKVRWRLLPGVF